MYVAASSRESQGTYDTDYVQGLRCINQDAEAAAEFGKDVGKIQMKRHRVSHEDSHEVLLRFHYDSRVRDWA